MPRTDAVSRVIQAPASRVYAACTDPEALAAWLPPPGMIGRFERFDLRPRGGYRLVLHYPPAAAGRGKTTALTDVVDARVVDLVPDALLVVAVDFGSDDPAYAGTMTMTWRFTPVDGGTLVDFVADAVPDGITAAEHAAGLAASLANLAAHVEVPRAE